MFLGFGVLAQMQIIGNFPIANNGKFKNESLSLRVPSNKADSLIKIGLMVT